MRRLAIVPSILFVGILIFTGIRFVTPAPERAVARMLTRLRSGNIDGAEKLLLTGSLNEPSSARGRRIYRKMFSSITYAVVGSVEAEDGAEVTVTVTVLDMGALLSQASLELLNSGLHGENASSKRLFALMEAQMKEEDVPYATSTVTVYLRKTGHGWLVDLEESAKYADAITGGLYSLLTS